VSPTINMPEVPVVGGPVTEKDAGQRVDMKPDKFDLVIENKGYLLAWTRASVCPCMPVTDKTNQPDPNCSLCSGRGWFYFGGNQTQDLSGYQFDPLQQKIIDESGAMIIRGIISNVMNTYDTLNRLTNWQAGTLSLTVRHFNKLGLYDKIVVLNPEIVYSQIIVADGGSVIDIGRDPGQVRYPITGINHVQGHVPDTSAPVRYVHGLDYQANDIGQLEWLPGREPAADTRLALHYNCHPTFLVVEHPHVLRSTLKKFKVDPAALTTPRGDPKPLPIQAVVKYEFLPR
jgi:hypothetical protein